MAAWVCVGCTTTYAVGAPRCPHCGSSDYREQGADMPKIHVNGGPTNRYEGDHGPEAVSLPVDAPVAVVPEGSEDVSAGSSSETSSVSTSTSSEPSSKSSPSPAPMTASHSGKGRTGSRTARSTGGGRETGTSAADN